jgi:hypothetical protein
MHRLVRENLENVLTGATGEHPAVQHLTECEECRDEVAAMRQHAELLHGWRSWDSHLNDSLSASSEPRPGFYARVLERIEAQTPQSIWSLFFESALGRRIAVASLALAVLMGVSLVSMERTDAPELASYQDVLEMVPVEAPVIEGQFAALRDEPVMIDGSPDPDSVLVNLVTYREQ